MPLVLWDFLGVVIPPPHASVLIKPSATTSPINFIPQRATNHTQQISFLSLFILPKSLQTEQRKPPTHTAIGDAQRHGTIFFLYLLPPHHVHLSPAWTLSKTELEGVQGGVPPVLSLTSFILGICEVTSFTAVTNTWEVRGGDRSEWNSRGKERRQRPRQWWSHGKSAPPVLKRYLRRSSPSRERKPARTGCTHIAHSMTFTRVLHVVALFLMQGKRYTSCTISPLQAAQLAENSISSEFQHTAWGSFPVAVFVLTVSYCYQIVCAFL